MRSYGLLVMADDDGNGYLRIGELARRTGLTVRALHHYDALGLLVPAQRSFSGRRLYSDGDVRRLYRVVALRRIGMPLAEIGRALDAGGADIAAAVTRQVDQLDAEIRERVALRDRLAAISDGLANENAPSVDDYLQAIERTLTMEKHFTSQQLDQLEQRRERLGEQAIKDVEDEWPRLFAAMQAARDRGGAPEDPEPQRIAARMRELIAMFHGGDEGLKAAQTSVWEDTPREEMVAMLERQGIEDAEARIPTPELNAFCERAHAAGGGC